MRFRLLLAFVVAVWPLATAAQDMAGVANAMVSGDPGQTTRPFRVPQGPVTGFGEVGEQAEVEGVSIARAAGPTLPPAYPPPSAQPSAAAAATLAVATSRAGGCLQRGVSLEVAAQCAQMGVPGFWQVNDAADDRALREMFPVSLRCPAENGGVMEYVMRNRLGQAVRARVRFSRFGEIVVLGSDSVVPPNRMHFSDPVIYRSDTTATDRQMRLFQNAGPQVREVFESVCVGSAEYRAGYFRTLAANAEYFRQNHAPLPTNSTALEDL